MRDITLFSRRVAHPSQASETVGAASFAFGSRRVRYLTFLFPGIGPGTSFETSTH